MERVVVVTGGNRGIGYEVCHQLALHGFDVLLTGREAIEADEAAKKLQAEGLHVTAGVLDVLEPKTIEKFASAVGQLHGRVDILINNAGIAYDADQRAASVELDFVRRVLETNLLGAWRTTQILLPLLNKSAHPRIVNVSSEAGSLASMGGGTPAYGVSKAALNALTRKLADELREFRILVNAVCPGWTATDMGGPGGRPVEQGAASVVWAALLEDDGPTGGFFRDGKPLRW